MLTKFFAGPAKLGALALCFLFSCTGPEAPAHGSAAPGIEAIAWYNNSGDAPSLASLRGKAVLLEFWATW
ncbi:MAG: hypothetical protein ACI9F9_001736 [Candidatus Paceibacteria bacterium]|jgi:hypothetical protein